MGVLGDWLHILYTYETLKVTNNNKKDQLTIYIAYLHANLSYRVSMLNFDKAL